VDYDRIAELIGRELGALLVLWFLLRPCRRSRFAYRGSLSACVIGTAIYFAHSDTTVLLGNIIVATFLSFFWLFRPLPPLPPTSAKNAPGRFVRALLRRS
jgi:hypothetical protein